MSANRIRVFTLNCWGLKFVAKDRTQRMLGIANALAGLDYDIVCLQEVWVADDFNHIRRKVEKVLPYAKSFKSGALGSGLVIFSRFPIVATSVHPYSLNGEPLDVAAGDWFVGKAAVSVTILHPVLDQVQVFNTHLFAKGGEDGPEHLRAHRLVNAWEFAKLARQAAELGRYVIAAGDFNSVPTSVVMDVIRDHAGLTDGWAATHSSTASPTAAPANNPLEAIRQFGVTCDSPVNTYSAGKPLNGYARRFMGKRLDYVLFRQPRRTAPSAAGKRDPQLRCVDVRVVFTELVPGCEFSHSDHFGLAATFEIPDENVEASGAGDVELPPPTAPSHLSDAATRTMVDALAACYRFSLHRANRELGIFVLCVLAEVCLAAGSAWFPYAWLHPLAMLLAVALAWLGTTMLYEGFLFGRWERNALMNVIEELETFRGSLGGAAAAAQETGVGR